MASTRHLQALIGGTNVNQLKNLDTKNLNQAVQKKRGADKSPNSKTSNSKRIAFGDLTNAARLKQQLGFKDAKKEALKKVSVVKGRRKAEPVKKVIAQPRSKFSEAKLDLEDQKVVFPKDVANYDEENLSDPLQEPIYSMDIFAYYKRREVKMKVQPYMEYQLDINSTNRTILVDWMVEVQESFELNHETLYLAVKLVDHYLMRTRTSPVSKANLQLLGATAIFVACKFDERIPPLIDDFLYICEDAYERKELIGMEMSILKAINYDLGIPLSYRFLRRYARTAKLSMEILTLARYILEMSLMKYEFVCELDSFVSAAALSLAMRMKNREDKSAWWSKTLEFYSGYSITDLERLVVKLNLLISQPFLKKINVIKTKYSHKIFFEVAKIPPMGNTN